MIRTYRRREVNSAISPPGSATQPPGPGSPGAISAGRRTVPVVDHALLDNIPAMLFTAQPDGMWDYVSPPFCAHTGCPAAMLTGLGWAAALHDDDQAPALNDWQAALRGGTPWQMEYRLRGADGVYRWFRMGCALQRDETGEIVAWAGIALPLESERQLTAERAMRQQAEQERDASDSVVAIVAHELRAPLTVLLGQAKLLQRRLDASPTAEARDQRAATTLVEQALRLARLLGALMDTAEIDRGQLQISATTLDLGALVQRMIEAFQVAVTTHTLQLQLEQGPFWVKGDALRLEQVLQNLIQNALKYSPAGSTVTITLAPEQLQVRITVSDQGIGIPASVMPLVFQRFTRAHQSAAQNVQGLGLGLYLSRAIMELHAGSIEVQSVEGEGCTATLLLPSVPLASAVGARGKPLHTAELGLTLDRCD